VAALTRRLGRYYDAPQDVEWCVADGKLYLLQSRPVTAVGGSAARDSVPASSTTQQTGTRVLWDNSNIIESYSGVTTPLTFSFIRDVYTEVYQEFCRIMGVDEETILRNRETFEMLGLIRGRVYYNLLNWYRMLALLPGYSINARFMEQMMGVREKLEETPNVHRSRRNPWLRLGVSLYRLVGNLVSLRGNIARFYEHLDATLAPLEADDPAERPPSELIANYRMLEQSLLQRWRVPILNDFYTMIFFGLLKSQIEKLGLENGGTLHNDLLAGEGGIISTEPMRLLREISNRIVRFPSLAETTINGSHDEFVRELGRHPEIETLVERYVQRFGDRYVGELKLESITPRHRPSLMQTMLAGYVQQGEIDPEGERSHARRMRSQAESIARTSVRGAVRRALFFYLLRQARERVKNRENLRFERTRVFGVVRRIFLGLGEHLAAAKAIDTPRDVFLLTKEEVFAWTIGASATTDLKALVAARRDEFKRFERMKMPDRFKTRGFPHTFDIEAEHIESVSLQDGAILHGLACCPGIVRGPVRVILDPTTAAPLAGAILVAERTDPGWAPLFPAASGLLVERGSLLSHSAIVAREMGIPAIVAVPGLMERLHDGMIVEMDGSAGTIRIIDEAPNG
jgi:pyruvate,water dikinase